MTCGIPARVVGARSRDRALVALAQEPSDRAVDLGAAIAAAPADLADHVVSHGIAGLALHHLRELPTPPDSLIAELAPARQRAWSEHVGMVAVLALVRSAMNELGVPWAVVKGPVLAELAYGRPDHRAYYDLDLLVHPQAFGDALQGLEAAGADLYDRNWPMIRAARPGQIALRWHDRPIDLHWHLLNLRPLPRRVQWDMAAVLERAELASIGGHQVPVLERVDALVHLCVHAALSGAHRLVWLKDVERQLATSPVPLDQVRDRAEPAGLWPATCMVLTRVARTFGWPEEPDPLVPWARLADRIGVAGFTTTRGVRFVARELCSSARPTVRASAAALAANQLESVAYPWCRDHRLGWLVPSPVATEEGLRLPVGTEADRAAYVAYAARS